MGTLCRIAWAGDCSGVGEAAREHAAHLEDVMTRFREDSEISRLSDQWRKVSSHTAAVLGAAKLYEHVTHGRFSALVGASMRAWDERVAQPDHRRDGVPATGSIRGKIELDGAWCRVTGAPVRAVDLGGIAKGYAADQLRALALEMGAHNVLVTFGTSSISVAGAPATIGLASPWRGWGRIGSLTMESGALAVSADPATTIGPTRRRSHVVDPDVGDPALTDLCGVVVCGADGMACEAFSTAYLAMGLDAAMNLDVAHPELDTIFMTIDGRLLANPKVHLRTAPGFQSWLEDQRRSI